MVADAQPHSAGAGALVQQDLQLSTLAVLLAFMQFVGAASQGDEELEDISIPVSLNTDLMLAVSIVCIGICFIAVWEFLKWCFETACSSRLSGWGLSSVSRRKARKLQRLRHQTAQAIEAELLAREEAASSSTRHVEHQLAFMLPLRGRSSTEPRPALPFAIRPRLLSTKFASSATAARRTVLSTAQGRNHSTLMGRT